MNWNLRLRTSGDSDVLTLSRSTETDSTVMHKYAVVDDKRGRRVTEWGTNLQGLEALTVTHDVSLKLYNGLIQKRRHEPAPPEPAHYLNEKGVEVQL